MKDFAEVFEAKNRYGWVILLADEQKNPAISGAWGELKEKGLQTEAELQGERRGSRWIREPCPLTGALSRKGLVTAPTPSPLLRGRGQGRASRELSWEAGPLLPKASVPGSS